MIRSAVNDGLLACVAKLIDMSRHEAINKQSDFIIDLAKVILIADDALQYRSRYCNKASVVYHHVIRCDRSGMAVNARQVERHDALVEELREIVGEENVLSEPEE